MYSVLYNNFYILEYFEDWSNELMVYQTVCHHTRPHSTYLIQLTYLFVILHIIFWQKY